MGLVRTDVKEECIATIIRVTRIGELGTTLAVTSKRSQLPRNILLKRRFLQEPHDITSLKMVFTQKTCLQSSLGQKSVNKFSRLYLDMVSVDIHTDTYVDGRSFCGTPMSWALLS
jgi:hypothetical protein